ncbi:acyltransferase [Pedobacter hartonius]|uniref:Acetyltransferase (Isoleucine patch superfamily) n=1 Tax=Pedobacter hartonius TaxID=425514 RepID=A0A1H4FQG9_9SPHI|nr:acyltransferase [Pedobacter hartonius]SEA98928.1 Acetyltransferase (isoleucine patch superfamily) [Pedobacter hartonius]
MGSSTAENRSTITRISFRIRVMLDQFSKKSRVTWLKMQGLQIGKNNEIGKILVQIPEQVIIGNDCVLEDHVRLRTGGAWKQSIIEIGDNNFIGHSTQINVGNHFKIGRDCMIAPLCVFSDAHHEFDDLNIPMKQQGCIYNKIEVRDDVWIGSGSVILGGVTIGTGVVIAAGAVVNKSIPDYEIWGGVPAKKIKSRVKE